jgi:hypothetical protein
MHRGNCVELEILRQSATGMKTEKIYIGNALRYFDPAKPVMALGPWRKLAVEVRPESIQVFWDDKCFVTVPRGKLIRSAMPLVHERDQALATNPPQYAPRDGLGLYVSQGVASFRNVVIEPLGDEN